LQKRITIANRVYYVLLPLPNSQSVFRTEKKTKFYKTLIRPVATDGAASWTLNKDTAIWLAVFGRKVLGRMSGGTK
jgi:hypothetical protein